MNYYVEKRGANHTLHLILSICTCGVWAVTGWPIAAIMGRKRTITGPNNYQFPYQHPQPPPQQPPYPPQGYGPPPGPYNPPPGPYGTPPRR
ncbi:hypothetical protein ACIQ9R_37520 [Streptomyces sp. NPDC094447]|uniref:hypothetical protein n=1 Tax=Streptomyces sp. NPDC094447 TaxID=3366062 RepID=UPI0038001EF8